MSTKDFGVSSLHACSSLCKSFSIINLPNSTVAFVIAFTTFVSVFVDWEVVWNCHDQASCDAAAANLIRANALADLSAFRFIIIVFELGIIAYWFFLVLQYFYEIMNVIQIKHVYNNTLSITENALQTINWEEVVHKIELVQR